MTTWELATDAQKREVLRLLTKIGRAGIAVPPLPAGARAGGIAKLTKRDAGTVLTLLREALKDEG